jgi:uncharacterized protein (DUF2461 family)
VYDEAVRAPMRTLLEALAPEFGATPVMFRPYRDIRFSKDKTPYKTAQGGFLERAPGVGYHLQVDADGVRVGGGFHAHDRDHTARWRAAVDSPTAGPALVELVDTLEKAGFEVGGTQVRTRLRGVPPDHPRLDLMRREFLTAARPADPATRTTIRAGYDELRPLGRTPFKVRPTSVGNAPHLSRARSVGLFRIAFADWIVTNAPPRHQPGRRGRPS